MKRVILIGRWQPLHAGHIYLIQHVLNRGDKPIVGIRDTNLDDKNPLTVLQRVQLLRDAFGEQIELFIVPDFQVIAYGRDVGYSFEDIEVPKDVAVISGTRIRDGEHRIIWLTGNSGAGKTTLAEELKLHGMLFPSVVLDGDDMRKGVSKDLGFSLGDREAHNIRMSELALALSKQQNVIVSIIAPTEKIRARITEICNPIWVHVNRRSPKDGNPDYPYETPVKPHVIVTGDTKQMVWTVLKYLENLDT